MEIRVFPIKVNQVADVNGMAPAAAPPCRSPSAGSIRPRNSPVPEDNGDIHVTPRRDESVPPTSGKVLPGSTGESDRGRRPASRDSLVEMSMIHASTCPASSSLGTMLKLSAGRCRNIVPGNPFAIKLKFVLPSCAATPGRRRLESARSKCCGAIWSTPSLRSTRNRSTVPFSMNQADSGFPISSGALPAQDTGVPDWVARLARERNSEGATRLARPNKPVVEPILVRHQFIMGAMLHFLAFIEDDDLVAVTHRA